MDPLNGKIRWVVFDSLPKEMFYVLLVFLLVPTESVVLTLKKTTWKCDDEEDEDKYERPCVEEGEREKADVTNHISSQTRRIYVLRCPFRSH